MSYLKQVKAFIRSHKGHTQKALTITLQGIEHMLEHRDWDGLAMLIHDTEGRMGSQIKAIVGCTVGGISLQSDKKHHTGMRFKLGDNFASTEKLAELRKLVENGETIFSESVNNLIGKEKKEPAKKSLKEVREHVIKFAEKHGYTLDELIEDPLMQEPKF